MRIIAGEFRRRKLAAPVGFVTRPMPDRVKESVFGMLGQRVVGAAVLDLFAGSGSIGLEAVSRGARSCVLVERDRNVAQVLGRNVRELAAESRCKVVQGDALGQAVVARCPRPVDLVFMDPPFPLVREPAGWARVKAQAEALVPLLADNGFLILRLPRPHWLESDAAPSDTPSVGARGHARRKAPRERAPRRGHWDEEARGDARRSPRPGRDIVVNGERWEQISGIEDRDDDDGSDHGVEVSLIPPSPAHLPADLALNGAIGPETHAYGKSAVHWYMRRREGA